jgi:hypothetical protein
MHEQECVSNAINYPPPTKLHRMQDGFLHRFRERSVHRHGVCFLGCECLKVAEVVLPGDCEGGMG